MHALAIFETLQVIPEVGMKKVIRGILISLKNIPGIIDLLLKKSVIIERGTFTQKVKLVDLTEKVQTQMRKRSQFYDQRI